jgi:hypothetical protein
MKRGIVKRKNKIVASLKITLQVYNNFSESGGSRLPVGNLIAFQV